jgi:uncharacterized protein YecE (DUF72 family)
VNSKRPKVELPRQPTLFELKKPSERTSTSKTDRPFSLPGTNILLGTSAFTASGWEGSFYPKGMRSRDFLSYYASQFQTVEIDSTFYGTPSASTVTGWNQKTPPDFTFAVKVPQVITHEKVLVGCEPEFDEFIERMSLLGDKLGPMLLQFPKFDKWTLKSPDEFRARLHSFFKRVSDLKCRYVVEIRNKNWLDASFVDLLREHNVALALTDTSFMPRPWEMKGDLDLLTADFVYVRWLGDRKGIEALTTTWEKVIVDRTAELKDWTQVLWKMINNSKIRKIFAYANNHYALCRCRHNAYNAAFRIMPSLVAWPTVFPLDRWVSQSSDA